MIIKEISNFFHDVMTVPILRFTELFLTLAIFIRAFSPAMARETSYGKYRVWDLDNLFFTSNARSILEYGNAEGNLGILGEPLNYHTAPSFLLAVFAKICHIDPLTLIYYFDGLFTLVLVLFGLKLIRSLSQDSNRYCLAYLVTLNLPFFRFKEDLRNFLVDFWQRPSFSFDVMFGSILGLVLLLAYALVLLQNKISIQIMVTILATIALMEIKPQYFLALIFTIFIVLNLSLGRNGNLRFLVLINLFFSGSVFYLFSIFLKSDRVPVHYFFKFNDLSFALLHKLVLTSPVIVFCFLISGLLYRRQSSNDLNRTFQTIKELEKLAFAVVLFIFTSMFVTFMQLKIDVRDWLSIEFRESFSRNDEQALYPFLVYILFLMVGAAIFVINSNKSFIFGFSILILIFSMFIFNLHFTGSNKTEDYSDLVEQKFALSHLPKNKIVITNDFAYPGDNYVRAYSGYLNSITYAQFYFAMPGNFQVAPSWSNKFTNSFLFFGSVFQMLTQLFSKKMILRFYFTQKDAPLLL